MERSQDIRPVFVVHSLAHAAAAAEAAAEAGMAVTLSSAPGATGYAGAEWFLAILAALAETRPAAEIDGVLDCGDDAAAAIEALHAGARWVRLDATGAGLDEVAELAQSAGARLNGPAGPALDLGKVHDIDGACRAFLARPPSGGSAAV